MHFRVRARARVVFLRRGFYGRDARDWVYKSGIGKKKKNLVGFVLLPRSCSRESEENERDVVAIGNMSSRMYYRLRWGVHQRYG